jgi:hypothetical protein
LFFDTEKRKTSSRTNHNNAELVFQNEEKENRASELIIANKKNLFKIKKKEKRAEELVKAKEQAEESDRLKLAFLANMTTRLEHQ